MITGKKPIAFGLLMGLAMPWMMHMGGAEIGFLFIAAHVLGLLMLASLVLIFPSMRSKVQHAYRHISHMPRMIFALAAGWALTCAVCLVIGGQHWT